MKVKPSIASFTVAAAMLACVVAFSAAVFSMLSPAPEIEAKVTLPAQTAENSALANEATQSSSDFVPKELSIPSLAVHAQVEQVGISVKNAVMTPKKFADVGWYKYGPHPGNAGTAIFPGHVDNAAGLPGVFKNLEVVQIGESVYVSNDEGKTQHYIIVSKKLYDYRTKDIATVVGTSIEPRILLITCEGEWLPQQKTYDHRLAVIARLVN